MVDKKELLQWSKKYDKDYSGQVQKEQELGSKLRKNKELTLNDLTRIAEWQYKDQENKKTKVLEAIAKNDEAVLKRISSQVFNRIGEEDAYRINSLITFNGVSPVLASVILTFFDPKRYGIFDAHVWKALLGNAPPNLFTAQNYLRLLAALRKTAGKHNLDARTVEKALFKRGLNKA
jgi:hypothetical protein